MLCCLPTYCVVHTGNRFDLWIGKQYIRLAFKTMYMQFCNEAKSCAYWLVNETLWYETETRPRHLIFSLRRDGEGDLPHFHKTDETETFGNYVSRPRHRDRDYIPGLIWSWFWVSTDDPYLCVTKRSFSQTTFIHANKLCRMHQSSKVLRPKALKMICKDFLVVKVNCWSYVFNIIISMWILRNIER